MAVSLGTGLWLGALTGVLAKDPRMPPRWLPPVSRPGKVVVGGMTFTGTAFEPKRIAVGEMALSGLWFVPKRIGIGEMTLTGLRE